MIAFEVYRNGQHLATAGEERVVVLALTVNSVEGTKGRKHDGLHMSVAGLRQPDGEESEHLQWLQQLGLRVGDDIRVKIIETDRADPPVDVRRHDHRPK
jgi:hypothetical protein